MSVRSARSSWPVAGSTWVASPVSSRLGDVEHDERVEPAQRGAQPIGLGQGIDRVAAGDDQDPHVAGLDLVGQRHGRHLVRRPGAGRAGCRARRPPAWPRRGGRQAEEAVLEPHAAGSIERAGEDQQHPPQPLGEDAVGGHRRAGAAEDRDPAAVRPQVGEEALDRAALDARGLGRSRRS